MERKVIRLANRTFIVSLPKRWVEKANVRKGDSLEVIEKDNELLIRAKREGRKKSIQLDISSMPSRFVERRLVSSWYRSGVPELSLKGPSSKLGLVESSASRFIGVLSVEREHGSLVLRNVATVEDVDFERVFRKAFWLLEEFCSQVVESMRLGNSPSDFGVHMRNEINRHTQYCRSVLNSSSGKTVRETNEIFFMLSTIDSISELLLRALKSSGQIAERQKSSLLALKVYDFLKEAGAFVFNDGSLERCYAAREKVHDIKPTKNVSSSDSYLILAAKLVRDIIESKFSLDFK